MSPLGPLLSPYLRIFESGSRIFQQVFILFRAAMLYVVFCFPLSSNNSVLLSLYDIQLMQENITQDTREKSQTHLFIHLILFSRDLIQVKYVPCFYSKNGHFLTPTDILIL